MRRVTQEVLYMLTDIHTGEVTLFRHIDKIEEASSLWPVIGPEKIYILKEEE